MQSSGESDDDEIVDGTSLASYVRSLGKASLAMTTATVNSVIRWSLILCFYLDRRADSISIKPHVDSDPSFMCYQSDGWTTFVRETTTVNAGDVSIRRTGKSKQEFLLERAVLKSINAAGVITAGIKVRPPRPLLHGKDCSPIFAASCETAPLLRCQGHQGMVASMYIQDGLHSDEFRALHRARHAMYYRHAEFASEEDRLVAESKDLVFGTRCKLHAGGSAVKWGMTPHSSEDVLDDIHISLKALTNTSTELRRKHDLFYARHVSDAMGGTRPWEVRSKYWMSLGVDPEMLNVFQEVNPRWDAATKTLHVMPGLTATEEGKAKILQILQYCDSWQNFSDTRFGGVGPASRRWLISQSVGLDGLVDLVFEDARITTYHLNGYKRCKESVRRWMSIGSLACWPPESFIASLLEDDRFYRRAGELWEDIKTEVECVCSLDDSIFAEICRVARLPDEPKTLRAEVLSAIHVALGYIYMEDYEELERSPMSYTQGDVEEKVRALHAQAEQPTEPVEVQMWDSMRYGVHPDVVARTFRLVADGPASTGLVEKGPF